MTQYQQTLIIPKPTQRLSDARGPKRHSGNHGRVANSNKNAGINSILAYFN